MIVDRISHEKESWHERFSWILDRNLDLALDLLLSAGMENRSKTVVYDIRVPIKKNQSENRRIGTILVSRVLDLDRVLDDF